MIRADRMPPDGDQRKAWGVPRRACVDLNTPAELAIRNAIIEVKKVGADVRLTEIVNDLSKAKDKLANYLERSEP